MYNETYKPLSPKLRLHTAFMSFTYEEMQACANFFQDMHKELDKPEGTRLSNYPTKDVAAMHQRIHDSFINASLSLEAAFKMEGHADND